MCLAAVAIGLSERFPCVLASNRDEYFSRAAEPLAWWRPEPEAAPILGGRDLSAGGTWLALNAAGRLALVTNVREGAPQRTGLPSRGELVTQWLQAPAADPQALAEVPRNGFNLLALDLGAPPGNAGAGPAGAALWVTNRPAMQRRLGAGLYGLSNAALDTPWPKVTRLKQRLRQALAREASVAELMDEAFAALLDREAAADADLPGTGVPLDLERRLSPAFIRFETPQGGVYGTRCSTVVVAQRQGARCRVQVVEHGFDEAGRIASRRAEQLVLEPPAP